MHVVHERPGLPVFPGLRHKREFLLKFPRDRILETFSSFKVYRCLKGLKVGRVYNVKPRQNLSVIYSSQLRPIITTERINFKLTAVKWGVAEFRFLAVPHPVANLTDAELDRRSDGVIADVVRLLKEGQKN